MLTCKQRRVVGGSVMRTVTFNLDPPKIGSPLERIFIFQTHSEKFVPAIGQPHKRKSVTTKNISGVHSWVQTNE